MSKQIERCTWCARWFTIAKHTIVQKLPYSGSQRQWCSDGCHAATVRREAKEAALRASHPVYDGFPLD